MPYALTLVLTELETATLDGMRVCHKDMPSRRGMVLVALRDALARFDRGEVMPWDRAAIGATPGLTAAGLAALATLPKKDGTRD